ncbi:3431_t:CDS:2 [Funneliformis caledonium]|uniref:3431_t:CDS:1 n=1 Tax=Funneliformis caledonium TaxID=1117310 RepID=A0A9N9F2G7_9GLOM|nr:3431_t:CDS:2 [Funneliformis caledonium]
MSESVASIKPFVCKWFGAHSRFSTQEELEHHVYNDHKDLTNLKAFYRGFPIYNCPWEGCKKQLSDIPKLEEHLHEHTQQKPFKCPICNCLHQFESLDKLNQHLISNHNDSVVDPTGAVDMTKQKKGDTAKYEVKKNNQSAKYEVKDEDYLTSYNYEDDEDYLMCKALAKSLDRKYIEKLLVENGLDDIDFDKFFST